MRYLSAFAVVAVLASAACSSRPTATPAPPSPSPAATSSTPSASPRRSSGVRPRHVFVIVFENKPYSSVIGSSSAPYFNELARRGGLATNYSAVSHPSLPNYLAMIGGSTFGISSDCTSCSVSQQNVADQLEAEGISWRAYEEGLPRPCFTGASSGRYAKKHDPFVYFTDITSNTTRCESHVVPLTQLAADVNGAAPPAFSFITPDLCHDMHDCSVATGDAWLRDFLPTITSSAAYRDGGIVFITFDEGTGSSNRVATVVLSATTSPGRRFDGAADHYSLLRTIEDLFGVAYLQHAGDPGRASLQALLE